MNSQGRAPIRFTLNGQRYELAREDVEARLTDVPPDVIRKHAVRINETWYPAVQAFEAATGIPRSEFISHTARRGVSTKVEIPIDESQPEPVPAREIGFGTGSGRFGAGFGACRGARVGGLARIHR